MWKKGQREKKERKKTREKRRGKNVLKTRIKMQELKKKKKNSVVQLAM